MATSSTRVASRSSIPHQAIEAATERLVSVAFSARGKLSARRIRQELEAEFACNLQSERDVILRTIEATLSKLSDTSNNQAPGMKVDTEAEEQEIISVDDTWVENVTPPLRYFLVCFADRTGASTAV